MGSFPEFDLPPVSDGERRAVEAADDAVAALPDTATAEERIAVAVTTVRKRFSWRRGWRSTGDREDGKST